MRRRVFGTDKIVKVEYKFEIDFSWKCGAKAGYHVKDAVPT